MDRGVGLKIAIYARISTYDQQTLPIQISAMKKYAKTRGWNIVKTVSDIGSGASDRAQREDLLAAARRREIDAILVWKLDRWGRSLADLVTTFNELNALDVGFISVTKALDFTTPSGRALAGMLALFAEFEHGILRERIKAGIAKAKEQGKPNGRPKSAFLKKPEILSFHKKGISNSEIAKRLGIGRTSLIRILADCKNVNNQTKANCR